MENEYPNVQSVSMYPQHMTVVMHDMACVPLGKKHILKNVQNYTFMSIEGVRQMDPMKLGMFLKEQLARLDKLKQQIEGGACSK